ncbi:hypothetical protein KIPB_003534 [Kipferlia bialata]|uniref:Kelch repeat type 1 n=1 Tax=Kipferlia bialata TaxID=797122 RepID=A0A9K3CU81_9EUKA|nr:hypothetical protein KIPB_003534 [Kipferlia bialata]|eukprot:g3534.t1
MILIGGDVYIYGVRDREGALSPDLYILHLDTVSFDTIERGGEGEREGERGEGVVWPPPRQEPGLFSQEGLLYVLGGYTGSARTRVECMDCWVYDLETGQWTQHPYMGHHPVHYTKTRGSHVRFHSPKHRGGGYVPEAPGSLNDTYWEAMGQFYVRHNIDNSTDQVIQAHDRVTGQVCILDKATHLAQPRSAKSCLVNEDVWLVCYEEEQVEHMHDEYPFGFPRSRVFSARHLGVELSIRATLLYPHPSLDWAEDGDPGEERQRLSEFEEESIWLWNEKRIPKKRIRH